MKDKGVPVVVYEPTLDDEEFFDSDAFPEFLLDYYKRDFWNSYVRRTRYDLGRN